MAYPPPALAVSRTNATPQTNTHPSDHNQIGQAINDIVAELGPDPSRGEATVYDKFGATDTAIGNLTTFHAAELVPNYIGQVDHRDGSGFALSAGSAVITTSSNGDANVPWQATNLFSGNPQVVVSGGDINFPQLIFTPGSTSTLGFAVRVWSAQGNAVAGNITVRVNWIATGPK